MRGFQAAVDAVRARLSCRAVEVQASLASQELLSAGTKLESLLRVAQLLGCNAGFIVAGKGPNRRVLPAPTEARLRLESLLKKLARVSPVLRVPDLQARWEGLGEEHLDLATLYEAIAAVPYTNWLDREGGWFWIDRPSMPMRRRIMKALAAASPLTIAELAEAIWRGPRTRDWPRVPLAVFQEFCRQLPECRAEANSVRAASPVRVREALRGDEKKLVEFLRSRDEACHLNELKEFASNARMRRQSLWMLLIGSPAVKRYGPRVYGPLRL